ncbi:MAG: BMP family ABC transporter substrate-binding protein [Candidatus Heimdallarchaeota archaeon]|nr:BMP family ABC transporter substrate-binding protein [Candidatus Heimdallarchaeota archaeon]
MKKIRFLITIIFITSALPISQLAQANVNVDPMEFAIIFATGGLGDKSFNDAAYRGMEQAIDEYGESINVDYVEPATIPEFATYQDDLGSQDKYELIICVGFLQTSALNVSANTYPNQDWVLIDDVINKTNINSITFKEHEGSFLVGAMAAMVTETDKVGFLGGLDIYLINKFKYGYEQGVKYINEEITVTSVYSPDPTNPWGDIAGGKSTAQTLYSAGNDIVFAAAGGTGIGVMQAANETEGAYAIGVDSDQDYLYPGKVLCSMLKLVETAVFTSIQTKMEGTWTSGHSELGIAEGGVGISPMTYTTAIKNGYYDFNGENKTRWEHIQDIIDKIEAGHLIIDDDSSEFEESIPVPGFEWLSILILLGLATIQIRRRR